MPWKQPIRSGALPSLKAFASDDRRNFVELSILNHDEAMSSDSSPVFGGGNNTHAAVVYTKSEAKQSTRATFDSEKTEDADSLGCVAADREDMRRLGKKQEFKRVFRTVTLLSFTTIGQVSWQYSLLSNTQALTDGGRAGIIWSRKSFPLHRPMQDIRPDCDAQCSGLSSASS